MHPIPIRRLEHLPMIRGARRPVEQRQRSTKAIPEPASARSHEWPTGRRATFADDCHRPTRSASRRVLCASPPRRQQHRHASCLAFVVSRGWVRRDIHGCQIDKFDRVAAAAPPARHRLDGLVLDLGGLHDMLAGQVEVPELGGAPRAGDVESGEVSATAAAPAVGRVRQVGGHGSSVVARRPLLCRWSDLASCI